MISIGLRQWYINIAISILSIIHRPVFYLKHDISETGYCLRLQVVSTQMTLTYRVSPRLQFDDTSFARKKKCDLECHSCYFVHERTGSVTPQSLSQISDYLLQLVEINHSQKWSLGNQEPCKSFPASLYLKQICRRMSEMLNLLINYLSLHYNLYISCSILRQMSDLNYVFRLSKNRSQKLRWLGHVYRMNSVKLVK
jgi:hypothetical protein